jgi:hypothetical protein
MRKTLTLSFLAAVFLQVAEAQDTKINREAQPIAALALSTSSALGQAQASWASVAFTSETTIAIGVCLEDLFSQKCSPILVGWEGGNLQHLAESSHFASGLSVHAATDGRILAVNGLSPAVLYSPDLSVTNELPIHLSRLLSPSGKTVAEVGHNSWKLYRVSDRLELIREGAGDLQSLSDEAVLIRERRVMRMETLRGQPLESFSVPSGDYASVGPLGSSRVYLDDCRTFSIIDLEGRVLLRMHPQKGCSSGDTSVSADGSRILFDYTDRKVSGFRHMFENIQTVTTLGMIGPEDVNREQVRVVDATTGKACFDWQRSFPMTFGLARSAAISPSGELVAIISKDKLLLFRLAASCGG